MCPPEKVPSLHKNDLTGEYHTRQGNTPGSRAQEKEAPHNQTTFPSNETPFPSLFTRRRVPDSAMRSGHHRLSAVRNVEGFLFMCI